MVVWRGWSSEPYNKGEKRHFRNVNPVTFGKKGFRVFCMLTLVKGLGGAGSIGRQDNLVRRLTKERDRG